MSSHTKEATMATTLPTFTPLEESLWLTLYARALDHRRPHSILGDAAADQIVRTVDYDYDNLDVDTNLVLSVALRAKKLDQVASDFLARHPDAVGLDLGAGFDTRFQRLAPPATVDWYDVDFPAVAAARQRLLPEPPNAHVIGADVTGPDWLDAVPGDRPAIIVADGLMGFLSQDELVSLWNRLVSHFPSGEIVLNSYTSLAIWIAHHARGTKTVADLVKFPGMDDPRTPEAWNPKLQLVREIVLSREPEVAEFPPGWRTFHRLAAHSNALSRMGTIVLHYRF
jgi:O-methyltransferase involved in polyketide biosynthesis